ncbi:uncharacterized protein LOC135681119 [Rhopilema esculentum]|uniref:uncharacterized protein LOC135681119 n=1 Tax=Rhopilema esculentum TaxID=499914 RepID=UPI0031CE3725
MDKKEDEEEGDSSPKSPTLHTLKTLERTWTGSSNGSIQQWIDSLNEGDWHELNEGQSTSPQEIETVTYSNIHFLPVPCGTEDELHLGADARSISYEGSERGLSMSPRLSPLLDDKLELPLTTDKSNGHIISDDTAGIDEKIYEEKTESMPKAQDLEKPMAHVKNEWMYEHRQNSFSSINSVSSLLAATEMDPEDMLASLGFGEEFSTPYHRIPARFFINPSQANGIDVDDFCSKFLDADHLKARGLESTRINVLGSRFTRSSIDLSWVNSDDKLLAKMRRLKFRQSSVPSITVNDDYDDRDGSSSDKASATRVPGNLRLSTVEEEYEPSSRKSSFSRSFSKEKAKLSKQERFEVDVKETAPASANGLNEGRLPGKDHKQFTSVESDDNVFERKESIDVNCVIGKCRQTNGSKQETLLPDCSKQYNGLGVGIETRNEFCEGEAEKAEKIGENSNTQECKKSSSISSYKNILDDDLEDQEDLFRWDRNNNTGLNGLDKAKFKSTPKKFSEPVGYQNHNGIVTRKHIFDDEEKVYLQDDIFTERTPSSGEKIRGDSKEDKEILEVYDEKKQKFEDNIDRVDPSEFSTISDHSYHDSIEDSVEDKLQVIEVPLEEEKNFSDDSLEKSINDDNKSAHSEYETDSIENHEEREDHIEEDNGMEPHTPSRVVYRSLGKIENLKTPEHGDSRETESSHQRGFGESLKLHGEAIIENIPFISRRRTVSVESDVVEKVFTGDESLSLGGTSQSSTKKPSRLRNYLRRLASGRIRSFMSLESLNNANLLNGDRMCKSHENLTCEEESPSTQALSQSCLEDHVDRNETYRSRRSEKLRSLTKQEVSREELLNSELNSLGSKSGTVGHPCQRTSGEFERRNGVNQSQTENSLEYHCSYLVTKKGGAAYTNGNADNKARGENVSRGRAKGLSKGFSVESSGFEDENDVSKSAAVREYNDCERKHACLEFNENTMGNALLGVVSGTSASPKSGPRSSTPTDSLVSVVDTNQFEYLVGQMSSLRKEVKEQEERVKTYIDESMERIRSSFLTEMSILNASLKTRSADNSLNGDING